MNRSYNHATVPAFNSAGSSAAIRAEFEAIEVGFTEIEAEIDGIAAAATWINPGYTVLYGSANQFVIVGVDARTVLQQYRRLRFTVNGSFVYSEVVSTLLGGGNTTVTIYDSVLTNQLTLAEYSIAPAMDAPNSIISVNDINQKIAAVIVGAGPIASLTDDDQIGMVEAGGIKNITWLAMRTIIQAMIDASLVAVNAALAALNIAVVNLGLDKEPVFDPEAIDTTSGVENRVLTGVTASFIKTDASGNYIHITPDGSNTILGDDHYDVTGQNELVTFSLVGTVYYKR